MTIVRNTTLLSGLGLKGTDVQTYTALLSRGTLSIRQISAVTKINRGTTYETLKRLVSLGLVSFRRKGAQRRFVAERPDKIRDLVDEKRKNLSHIEESVVPSLMALSRKGAGEPKVRFYEDDDGIVAILRDVLTTVSKLDGKEYFAYSSRPLRKYLYRRFPNFTRRRIKEGIFVRVIALGEGGDPAELSERKWIEEPANGQLSSYILIYADKVALISVSANETPYAVVIEEPGVAATQKFLFQKLWQSLP